MKLSAIALLATAFSLQAQADIQLLPAGEFVGRDGRPGEGLTWKLSDDAGRALAAKLNARHAKTRFNLDYEHQALAAEENGQPAPASGWASRFEWRDGEGLFALNVKWTTKAKQMIEDDEYSYISPVIVYDKKSGHVTDVFNAALVNNPAILDMSPVTQERIARLNAHFSTHQEIPSMNPILQALLEALGLPATDATTKEQAVAALAALKTSGANYTALLKSLGVAEDTAVATATTAIAALRTKADKAGSGGNEPDPTKWVSMADFNALNSQVTALSAKSVDREVDELIAQATADGKCAGVVAEVWRKVGKADIAQLRALVEKTPGNPALAGQRQTQGKQPAGDSDTLTDDEIAVCKATGITREDFLKNRKEMAAAAA